MAEWNYILPEKAYSLEEPDDSIVSLAKSSKGRTMLDLACGAGRHIIYMADQGFDVNGADISLIGLKMTKKRLQKRGLEANLVRCDMNHLPYVESCFNILICTHAIYHQKLGNIKATLLEVRRVWKKRGSLLIDFLSKKAHSRGKGVKIEESTFLETEGREKGVIHHYTDEQELRELFKGFGNVRLSLQERERDGKLRSRWVVTSTTKRNLDQKVNK